eukprot:TRINITY_DN22660_c0_g1_i1.p1 TRINITY_DN22660_c0_g1~~TRINITY_DN22660_c0_g1_i1.p1  ORF type:complete len:235 (-),score=36.38 TRINITY_DN22660_c0_g1_i1:265-969(-)
MGNCTSSDVHDCSYVKASSHRGWQQRPVHRRGIRRRNQGTRSTIRSDSGSSRHCHHCVGTASGRSGTHVGTERPEICESAPVSVSFRVSNQTNFPFRLVITYSVCSLDGMSAIHRKEKCTEVTVIPTFPKVITLKVNRVERVCIIQAWEMCVLEGPFEASEMEATVSIFHRLQPPFPTQRDGNLQPLNAEGEEVLADEQDWQRQCGTMLLCQGIKGPRRFVAFSSIHHQEDKSQ